MGFLWRAVGEEEQCDMLVLLHVSFVALALLSHAFVCRMLEKGDCLHPETLSNDSTHILHSIIEEHICINLNDCIIAIAIMKPRNIALLN